MQKYKQQPKKQTSKLNDNPMTWIGKFKDTQIEANV